MKGLPPPRVRCATLGEALADAARTSHAVSFCDSRDVETSATYAAIHSRAREIAGALVARGLLPHDRVALVLPTSPAFVECFFGVLLAGAIPVPLYPPVRLGRMDEYHRRTTQMMKAVEAAVVISDDRIRRLLGVAVDAARPRLGCVKAAELVGSSGLEYAGDASEIALIQFSSGTTVDSKPVALTHANILANVAAIDAYITEDGAPNPSGVSWLPLYHDMGLIGCLLEALYRPGSITLIPPEVFLARPVTWLRAISRRRATISAAPNFAYGYCTRRIKDEEMEGVDLSSWSLALNGAEPVTDAVLQRFADRFARWGFRPSALTPVYGLSEAALAVTFKPVGGRYRTRAVDADFLARERTVRDGTRPFVSVGRPLAGVEVAIRDSDGRTMPPGATGRIWVRGPSVMRGYFDRPELTAAAIQDGWLDTGDVGFEDAGELYICGREKELLIIRGANHAPHDFETALDGVQGVRAGCVAAVGFTPEQAEGEELLLLVETEGEAPTTTDEVAALENEIRTRVVERTGVRPEAIQLLPPGTLPRTSSGKIRRREAARLWSIQELVPPKPVTALRMTLEMARGEWHHLRTALAGPAPDGGDEAEGEGV